MMQAPWGLCLPGMNRREKGLDGLACGCRAELDADDKLLPLTLGILEIIVGQHRPPFFQGDPDQVKVAFDFAFVHIILFLPKWVDSMPGSALGRPRKFSYA